MDKYHLLGKGFAFILVVLFVGANVVPCLSSNDKGKTTYQTSVLASVSSSTIDWWPMFHHDSSLSGRSNSSGPETNTIRWWYKALGNGMSSPVVADNKVYIGSSQDNLYCFDAETGVKIWEYSPIGTCALTIPAIAYGKIYFGSPDGNLSCLNATTGTKIWDFKPRAMAESPTVVDGKVFFGSMDYNVYCLNAETGVKIWNYTAGWIVSTSIAVVDGKVYFASHDWKVYCLNVTTGLKIWDFMSHTSYLTSPAVFDGKVFIGSVDDKFYCLTSNSGVELWERTITGGSCPAVADDKVYLGSRDGTVYCLDAHDGREYWDYATGDKVTSSPAVADGKVYVGSDDHKVYCLNTTTGTLIWDYTTGNTVTSSPAIADGNVYIGSNDGTLYCFGKDGQGALELDIAGGLGINAFITNKGTVDANGIEWQIHVEGGIFEMINKTINGTIDVAAGVSKTVRTGLFFGFGPIAITAKITNGEITAEGTQVLIFTMVKK